MQKRSLGLIVFLLIATFLISGCGKKADKQSAIVNNAVNNQNQEQNSNPNQNQANTQSNTTVNPSGLYSVNELFAMNRPMKCTWKESATEDKDVTNIIYINGKKFYQDVTMGDLGHSFMIYDGEYLYIWNDFNDAASKMKDTKATTGIESKKDSAGLDQKKDFICENWVADNSFFIPPTDKNFKDVTEEMNQAVQEMGNGGLEKSKQQACDLCRNAPSQELKDKCLGDIQCD
jgi:hypothetical protein